MALWFDVAFVGSAAGALFVEDSRQEPITEDLGRGLYQRHDAAMNFIRTGGRFVNPTGARVRARPQRSPVMAGLVPAIPIL